MGVAYGIYRLPDWLGSGGEKGGGVAYWVGAWYMGAWSAVRGVVCWEGARPDWTLKDLLGAWPTGCAAYWEGTYLPGGVTSFRRGAWPIRERAWPDGCGHGLSVGGAWIVGTVSCWGRGLLWAWPDGRNHGLWGRGLTEKAWLKSDRACLGAWPFRRERVLPGGGVASWGRGLWVGGVAFQNGAWPFG